MKRVRNAAAIGFVLLAAACQGSFGSGPQIPGTLGTPGAGPYGQSPASSATQAPSSGPSGSASETRSFLIADVAKGIPCPAAGGFSCVLHFNLPAPAPAPSGGTKTTSSPSPSPTPTPTPTPSPGSPGQSAAPSPSAPAGPSLALSMSALPADAPKMMITAKNALPTTAVMKIAIVPSQDFTLEGPASAVFTLPKDQVENRGFAIQLFEDTLDKKKRHVFKPLYTLAKSSLSKQTLTFSFTPPKITLPKGHTYLIVLYGDQRAATASPAATSSATAPEHSEQSSTPAGRPTPY